MHDFSDMALVREYVRVNSEAAFAELVERHISLVYSAAFRHAGQAAHAQEITQAVFIILARKAAGLRPDTVLAGWLCETTRLTALSFMRGEHRRQRREQEAYMQSTLRESTDETVWNQLSPLLDEAMSRLGRKERDAVVLRYFKDQNLREVAEMLNINEPAAQKRVNRALEKLRKFFTKRGVDSTAAIIAGAISANSVQAAPLGLAKTISVVAMAKGAAAASASTLALVKGTMKMMTWIKIKVAVVVSVGVLLAFGVVVVSENKGKSPGKGAVVFTAAGFVSSEFHQQPFDTNNAITSDGKVLFLYSNGVWQVQFVYQHFHEPPLNIPGQTELDISSEMIGEMIDVKRIPDGTREIITAPAKANEIKPANYSPFAMVWSNTFPEIGHHELFLPWLSLCPNPELPLVNSNRIHINFEPKLFDNSKDGGGFKVSYIEPEKQFLSELIITNNGTIFLSDGRTLEYPAPYNNDFICFYYKVLETTNCDGINFPLSAVLYQYAPLPDGKSPEDTYQAGITKINIQQIDVGDRNSILVPVPKSLVALDTRFGLPDDRTVNYEVTNDQWYSLTNARMQQLGRSFLSWSSKPVGNQNK